MSSRVFVAFRFAEVAVLKDATGKAELDLVGLTLVVFLPNDRRRLSSTVET